MSVEVAYPVAARARAQACARSQARLLLRVRIGRACDGGLLPQQARAAPSRNYRRLITVEFLERIAIGAGDALNLGLGAPHAALTHSEDL